MKRITLRPATRADFDTMLAEPLPFRVRAIAGEVDGEILGVGGLAFPPNGNAIAFLQASTRARDYPISLHRAALKMFAEARHLRLPRLVATAETGIEPARRWLARLGFEPTKIDGHEVWTWHP